MVQGKRLPAAEAPKWAICSVIARMPRYAMALRSQSSASREGMPGTSAEPPILPPVVQPTRMPRNPDYKAPPKVPAGSPLPDLGNTRFGLPMGGNIALFAADPSVRVEAGALPGGFEGGEGGAQRAQAYGQAALSATQAATLTCVQLMRGSSELTRGSASSVMARDPYIAAAEFAMRDKSLPMGFALFEQGRYAEALPYFEEAARGLTDHNGGDEAALFVGKLLLAGFGKGDETDRAIKSLKRAALINYVERLHQPVFDPARPEMNTASGEAAMMLGAIYRQGLYGTTVDMNEACRWYRRAAYVGHVAAYKVLGDIQYFGLGMPRDPKAAFADYERGAKRHLASAQTAVGDMLHDGDDGIAVDLPRAIAWYREALKHDDPDAAYALARAYERGEGVPADREVAFGLYRKAALSGSAEARVAVGHYYQTGTFVPRDETTARRWFELASQDGNPDGMFNYAALLANGRGGDRDLPRAWAWLKVAAARGNEQAATAMAAVEARMTAEEKQKALALSGKL
ncbi:tetratricopeptide repeat protein [Sphingomonas sp. NPDC019816]|uniref:tetratricopeptide repeat protein n=1 Tax=Sphingomonas sp. NPDC019816 TaxID=3390679 RepID=UPI003D052B89